MEELKPCPFCGGEATLYTWDDESLYSHLEVPYYQAKCCDCDAQTDASEDESEAIESWNRRAQDGK